jgi:hypothetical protein
MDNKNRMSQMAADLTAAAEMDSAAGAVARQALRYIAALQAKNVQLQAKVAALEQQKAAAEAAIAALEQQKATAEAAKRKVGQRLPR